MKAKLQSLPIDKLRKLMESLGKNHAGMSKRELVRTLLALTGL